MKNIKNTILFAGFVGIASMLLFSCGNANEKPTATPEIAVADESVPVKTAPVLQKNISLPVSASGFLTSDSEQRLAFKIGGVIQKIYVEEGDNVRPGQLLAVLDQSEINGQVAMAKEAVLKAERDLARVEGLYKDSSATLELLQNATTARDVARENAGIATFNQKYAEIRATQTGKVIKKLANDGEIIGPGMPVFVLFGNGAADWVVKVSVSDRDWARLKPGMNATIHMDAYPESTFSGKISDIAPAADPSNGLYPIEIRVAAQGKRFAPGLFATLEVATSQARAYALVPVESVVEGEGKSAFVYAIQPDGVSVRKIPVQVAFLEGNMAVLSDGLSGVGEVVTAGSPYLTERSRVKKM